MRRCGDGIERSTHERPRRQLEGGRDNSPAGLGEGLHQENADGKERSSRSRAARKRATDMATNWVWVLESER